MEGADFCLIYGGSRARSGHAQKITKNSLSGLEIRVAVIVKTIIIATVKDVFNIIVVMNADILAVGNAPIFPAIKICLMITT